MATIQWRPAVNALTKPVSCRIQIIPRNVVGYEEMAAAISTANPVYNADLVRSLAPLMMEWIQDRMINGDQVTLPNAFLFSAFRPKGGWTALMRPCPMTKICFK